MDNASKSDFVLQKPEPDSKYYLKCKIFFFDSPRMITVEISYNELARDVIRHAMTLYRHSPFHAEMPLQFPEDHRRYALYFIDEDESEHAPEYDMGPRNPDEPIGEFMALAFVPNKKFKAAESADPAAEELDMLTSEERQEFKAKDLRLLVVKCNTVLVSKQTKSVKIENRK